MISRSKFKAFIAVLVVCSAFAAVAQPYGLNNRIVKESIFTNSIPIKLSETNIFSAINTLTFSPWLIPYSLNSALWSDGEKKLRFLFIPGTSLIGFDTIGHWNFPQNTVLIKNFFLDTVKNDPKSQKIIETRFLIKDSTSESWKGYSYLWDDNQQEALLLSSDYTKTFEVYDPNLNSAFTHSHYYPQNRCQQCHTTAANVVLGIRTGQLNKQHLYGTVGDNQLRSLNHIGLFTTDIGEDYKDFPLQPNPADTSFPISQRAQSYFGTNCAHCHQPASTCGFIGMNLRLEMPLDSAGIIDIDAVLGFGPPSARLRVQSGFPDSSAVYQRMNSLNFERMPPLATSVVDSLGVSVISEWIKSLDPVSTPAQNPSIPKRLNPSIRATPNPFNLSTTIQYTLAFPSPVDISVFDLQGNLIRTLFEGDRNAGLFSIDWNGKDNKADDVKSGTYVIRAAVGEIENFRKVILVR